MNIEAFIIACSLMVIGIALPTACFRVYLTYLPTILQEKERGEGSLKDSFDILCTTLWIMGILLFAAGFVTWIVSMAAH